VQFSHGNFYDELQSAALVICDHNQTSFLESLSNNKPTIIFWNDDYTKISKKASEHFDELAKVGVFYTSPKKAAYFVSNLVLDGSISDWWMDSSRQTAVSTFVHEYAKINDQWVDDYCSMLI
jgi:putative transferase (TIGR04331 family)